MNKRLLIFLPFLLLLAGVFTSCEEVEEVGKYDNWRERNEAYIDSLNLIIGGRASSYWSCFYKQFIHLI